MAERVGELLGSRFAMTLVVVQGTAKLHVSHILSKLGVTSGTQAIVRASTLGLLNKEQLP